MKFLFKLGLIVVLFFTTYCNNSQKQDRVKKNKLKKELFVFENQNKFTTKKLNNKSLKKVSDSILIKVLKKLINTQFGLDEKYNSKFYFYSLENKLNKFHECTISCEIEDRGGIFYVILDENYKGVSCFPCAFWTAIGDYTEEASGEFNSKLQYTLSIIGEGDEFEGEETTRNKITNTYTISKNGSVAKKE